MLRRLGGTGASGAVGVVGGCRRILGPHGGGRAVGAEGGQCARHDRNGIDGAPAAETERLEISATADTPATQRVQATTTPTTTPVRQAPARRATPQGFSWRAIAGTVAIVFVLALLFITAIELISGKPLSAIFGGADTGTTLKNLVNPSPAPPATPTSTTSTTSTTGDVDLHHDDERGNDHDEHHRTQQQRDDNADVLDRVDDDHHGSGPERRRQRRRRRRPRDGVGPRYQPLNSEGRRSTKLAMPSLESSVLVTSSWPMASS